ncbi:MAG: hypothetical protein OXH14_04785 [Alphaproteobacteria bacterium]|nr:hypothetical protein [Alphaproteobacteria bacterium]MCY3752565.1 hypothetical protein [Alphaproteobacteria bacterium]
MDTLALRIFAEYGPLALGWGLAVWLLHRDARGRQLVLDVIVANTRALAVLAEKIDALRR